MFSRIKALFQEKAANPECFTGLGIVLITDQCAAQLFGEPLDTPEFVEAMNEMLSFQTDTLEHFGAVIDQSVGGSVQAYWPPRSMPGAIAAAVAAARAILTKKESGRIRFEMKVSFSIAEFSVAALGPAGRQRVQAIGRTCERASSMHRRLRAGGVITDLESFQLLSPEDKAGFQVRDGYAYRVG